MFSLHLPLIPCNLKISHNYSFKGGMFKHPIFSAKFNYTSDCNFFWNVYFMLFFLFIYILFTFIYFFLLFICFFIFFLYCELRIIYTYNNSYYQVYFNGHLFFVLHWSMKIAYFILFFHSNFWRWGGWQDFFQKR